VIASQLQPDQQPSRWDDHVLVYEAVFEPFSTEFAAAAARAMALRPASKLLDVGCGSGGATLMLAAAGHTVTAIDASDGMIARVKARAAWGTRTSDTPMIDAKVMDGQALSFADATFDAALSVFGVILFPDAVKGLAEMRRVVKPGGQVAVVTWTEPQNYALATVLRAAILSVKPDMPPASLPAQLRYRERADYEGLFRQAGFSSVEIKTITAHLRAPSARWLADRIAFAPGMAAMLAGLGALQPAAIEAFVTRLEGSQGTGPVSLAGVAFVGIAEV
jgi:ubiquinone/menaquinone biosynthesis C-methylase UbiE